MQKDGIHQHISRKFDEDLEEIRAQVLAMGGVVETQLRDALAALLERDIELAEVVIEREIKVNTYEVSIDQECTGILACRQPAASDLRLVVAIIKTITDLERIGDEAKRIALMAIDLAEKQGPKSYYVGVDAMGNFVSSMVHKALNAFARMESEHALVVVREEPRSDEQYGSILRQLITYMMEDPRNISASIDAIWTVRALERIGDHAQNICEYVIYLVEGKDVRHISIKQMEKALGAEHSS